MTKGSYSLKKGRKITIERDNGTQQIFFYAGTRDGEKTFLQSTRHSLGDILELRLDRSYRFSQNSIRVPADISYFIYGRWHPDYESKHTFLGAR